MGAEGYLIKNDGYKSLVQRNDLSGLFNITADIAYYNGGRNNGKSFLAEEYWRFSNMPKIKKVIFNNPATIIIWADKSKTVVKCMDGDEWDPEKGFVMAYLTKLIGQKQLHAALKKIRKTSS